MKTDLDFIADPNTWPQWPFLPLKRGYNDQLQCGYLYGDPALPIILYLGNIWSPTPDDPTIEYDSIKSLLDDGWKID